MIEPRHPLAKLAAALVLVAVASLLNRSATQGMIAGAVLALLVAGGVSPLKVLRRMLPFAFLAVAMSWVFLVADNPAHRAVAGSGWGAALTVAGRILTMGLVSLAFAETTRPADLARALAQNARLPRRIVYGVLAAIQFLPALAEDYAMLRMVARTKNPEAGRIRRFFAGFTLEGALTLFAGALRRADSAALSMQMRGLAADSPVGAWRRRPVGAADIAFVLAATALAALALALDG